MSSWIKLYYDILDDPKMGRMDDATWRMTITLLLAAGEFGKDGLLPPVEDLAWRLRIEEDALENFLQKIERVGIVTRTEEGEWLVTNFARRQGPAPVAERVRQYRERKSNDIVTNRYKNCNDCNTPDTDTDTDTDTEQNREEININPPPVEIERIEMLAEEREFMERVMAVFAPRKFLYFQSVKDVLSLRMTHGEEKVLEILEWAASKNMLPGDAVKRAKRLVKTWGNAPPATPGGNGHRKTTLEALEKIKNQAKE